jgi:hypothetical protein
MPRDINGNFTLDPSNPVIPGSVIETGWANPTLTDIAAALTDSLSRSGAGGMLAPFRFSDGTLAAPGIAFTNEPSSGLYRAALNDIRFAIGSSDVMRFIPGGVVIPAAKSLTASSITATTALASPTVSVGIVGSGGLNVNRRDNGALAWTLYSGAGNLSFYDGAADRVTFGGGGGLTLQGTASISGNALIHGATGNRGAGVEILYNSVYNAESSALYIMSGLGTAGEQAMYFAADRANGVSVISSLVPGTGPAPLWINPLGGTLYVGNPGKLGGQFSTNISTRGGSGNSVEFGHTNAAGYGSAIGFEFTSGKPGLFLCCEVDGGATYRTRGLVGNVIQSDLQGQVIIAKIPLANAAAQAAVTLATFNNSGNLSIVGGMAGGTPFSFYTGVFGVSAVEQLRLLGGPAPNVLTISASATNPTIGTTGGSIAFSTTIAATFESAEQGIPVGNTVLSVAHGLGRTPKLMLTVLRCKIAELGYAIGDEVAIPSAGVNPMVSTWASSTTCKYVCSSSTPQITDAAGATGVQPITTARWRVVFYAW